MKNPGEVLVVNPKVFVSHFSSIFTKKFKQLIYISMSKMFGASTKNQLKKKFGQSAQHWFEWGVEKTNDRSAGAILFFCLLAECILLGLGFFLCPLPMGNLWQTGSSSVAWWYVGNQLFWQRPLVYFAELLRLPDDQLATPDSALLKRFNKKRSFSITSSKSIVWTFSWLNMYQKVIEIETTKYKNFLDLFTSVSISSFQTSNYWNLCFYAFVQGFHGPCSYQSHFNHIAVMWEKKSHDINSSLWWYQRSCKNYAQKAAKNICLKQIFEALAQGTCLFPRHKLGFWC